MTADIGEGWMDVHFLFLSCVLPYSIEASNFFIQSPGRGESSFPGTGFSIKKMQSVAQLLKKEISSRHRFMQKHYLERSADNSLRSRMRSISFICSFVSGPNSKDLQF